MVVEIDSLRNPSPAGIQDDGGRSGLKGKTEGKAERRSSNGRKRAVVKG